MLGLGGGRLLRGARRLDLGQAGVERPRLAGPGAAAGGVGEAGGEREALGGELLPALGGGEREERAPHLALDRAAAVGEQVLGVGHVVLGGRDAEPALAAHLDLLLELDASVLGVLVAGRRGVTCQVGREDRVRLHEARLAEAPVRRLELGGRDAERRARRPRALERFVESERSGGRRPTQRGAQEDRDERTSRGPSRHHASE